MYTSVVLFALAGSFMQPALTNSPKWTNDYGLAWKQGHAEKKPLAVFIGSGDVGVENVSREGKLSPEAKRLLDAHYICVYVDAEGAAGKSLAASLKVTDGRGLVISDRSGDYQAFRHQGRLSGDELEHYLRK